MTQPTLQEAFDAIMMWSPAEMIMYKMTEDVANKHMNKMDPKSGMFPDEYYNDMRAVAESLNIKFIDPRGAKWRASAKEGNVTVH